MAFPIDANEKAVYFLMELEIEALTSKDPVFLLPSSSAS
jgi:hypothetical protein